MIPLLIILAIVGYLLLMTYRLCHKLSRQNSVLKYELAKNKKATLIKMFEESLKRYEKELENNPKSTFYKGLVEETRIYLKELKSDKANS